MHQNPNPQLAGLTLQFLNRVQLTPPEVEAFIAVRNWLQSQLPPAPPPTPPEQVN